jgi:hypothetical protein
MDAMLTAWRSQAACPKAAKTHEDGDAARQSNGIAEPFRPSLRAAFTIGRDISSAAFL